jgi:branched-subunit amino acid ABC-type transport system permease component
MQLLINGLAAGATAALLAFGFGLVYFTTGVFHFAHGAAFAVAGYTLWALYEQLGWPLLLAAVPALAAAALTGWLVETLLYRPLRARRASSDALFLTSLGAYSVVANLLGWACGHDAKALTRLPDPSWTLVAGTPPVVITAAQVVTLALAATVFAALAVLFKRTRFGLAVRAYAANPTLAGVVGVDERRLLPQVAVLGALLAGVAALTVAADVGVSPDMGLPAVLTGAVATVLGGVGSLSGAALGGLGLGLLQHLGRHWLAARWEEAVTFAVLLIVLLTRRGGGK